MHHKHLIILLLLLLLTACGRHRQAEALLMQADSLMASRPDAAYALLDSVGDEARGTWGRADRMRYELTLAEAMNKTYQDFTTDSVMKRVARYYDRHGSANQQLKAHYLLGCTYRDMGEAPAAINAWKEAVEKADTLSKDCDYSTLYRVYGQMAVLFYRQYLPEEELIAREQYARYALLSGDTLSYIRGLLLKNDASEALGDTSAVLQNVDYVRRLYLERGLMKEAAQVYPSAIKIALNQGSYEKAHHMMTVFEHESGLFDINGNIAPTREIYYYRKGQYYLGVHQLDSAEHWFRRLLGYPQVLLDGYRGLLSLYTQKHCTDSIYKYARLYEDATARYLRETQSAATVQAKGMYDYSRQQNIARAKEKEADELRHRLTYICLLVAFVAFLIFIHYQKKKRDRRQLQARYDILAEALTKARQEAEALNESLTKKEATQKLITQKEEQIKKLESMINNLRKEMGIKPKIKQMQKKDISKIIDSFHYISQPHFEYEGDTKKKVSARAATEHEWKKLMTAIQHSNPDFYLFIIRHKLSKLKLKVCVLSYLGFDNQEIITLTNASKGSVPNARYMLAKELFGLDSALDLDKHLRML